MDIVTHGLASFAVARGFFPRANRPAILSAVLAGTIANIDWLSSYFGPSAYLTWHGTYTHSVLTAILIAAASLAIFIAKIFKAGLGIETEAPKSNSASIDVRSLRILILGTFLSAPVCRFAAHRYGRVPIQRRRAFLAI